MRLCSICKQPISQERLLAVPQTPYCISCRKENDEEPIIGYMSWEHKTAPELLTSLTEGREGIHELQRYSRRGPHTQLPLQSPKNPRIVASVRTVEGAAEFDSIRHPQEGTDPPDQGVADFLPAHCHPERPRVTPDGKCLDCALNWYEVRLRKDGE